ncbi:hypothetical protein SH2C18_23770 [Clostridium sediminicola]|uniref:sensor domain-containing protein n=1 Tax=Clostridium sediminicola TaxID=3114879 RepID=UPI0031F23095
MNIMLALIIAALCILLFITVLLYISDESRMKSFTIFAIGGSIVSITCFLKVIDIELLNIIFLELIEKKLFLVGALVAFFGVYKYGKKYQKENKFLDIFILCTAIILSILEVALIHKNNTFDLIFGIACVIGTPFIYYFLRKSIIGKYISGFSCMLLGVLYIFFGTHEVWQEYYALQYLLNAIIFILIGLGMIISYFEEVKIQLSISEHSFKVALEALNGGLWECNLLTQTISLPKDILELIGFDNKETSIKVKKLKEFIYKGDLEKFEFSLKTNKLSKLKYYKEEFRIKSQGIENKYFLFNGKVILNKNGKPIKISGFVTDITERKEKEENRYNLAYYDQATLLPNRNYFEQEFFENIDKEKYFTIFSIGIIGFKNVINDLQENRQHELLKGIIDIIKEILPTDSVIDRYQENEFVCVIYNNNYKKLDKIINKILDNINNSRTIINNGFKVKPVIGISLFPHDGSNPEEIAKNATLAMHKSLEEGKKYKFFDHTIKDDLITKLELQDLLYKAVEKKEFQVFYQLQMNSSGNSFMGAEALVRWNNAEKGMISPGQFIPIAETNGLIVDIGEFVLWEACFTGKRLHQRGHKSFCVSVNISLIQLRDNNFDKLVKSILKKTGFNPNCLILEMSERVFLESMEECIKTLEILRSIGIRIAIDDFGKGAVPLSYLLSIPIDILKIDKSFMLGLTKGSKKIAIIDSMIGIAKKLNLLVAVQGIETEEQMSIIQKLDCDIMQGFLFSKPGVSIDNKMI